MGSYKRIEITVGIFVFLGIVSLAVMAIRLGEVGGIGASGYQVKAMFNDAGGLRAGADVMIAGVVVGRVDDVHLTGDDKAELILRIDSGINITRDAIASIRTKGIIGERYVRVSQGGDSEFLANGDEIEETESAINIEDLVSKYIFKGNE